MLWRLLFIALIGGAQFITSDRCHDSAGELIQMTVWRSSSSTVSNSHPERAIDGNKDPCVTITSHSQDNSAWTVQLSGVYQVSCVSIYSKDQTGTSMTGAPVQIHIRSYNNSIDKKICTHITPFTDGEWNDFTCTEQVSGRYVTVSLPGKKALSLCEVKIYGKRKDLINTTNSITSQSSDYRAGGVSYSSGRATDGKETACAHTEPEQGDHWWRIELPGIYDISCVSIYNTKEDNTNMNGAQIHVGNSRENNSINNKICANMRPFTQEQWNNYTCAEQVSGRYVTVSLQGRAQLILCEVKIYGKRKDLINTTNSITSQSSDSSTLFLFNSGRAIDGNKKQCAITNNDRGDHWWRIDLLGVYNISCISIYNKIEHNITMTGAQIHVGNSRENNGTNNNICANMRPFTQEQWNNYTCAEQVSGRYVTVSLQGRAQLILCEVKIYGKRKDLINTTNSITSQSSDLSTLFPFNSGRAIDGNKKQCAITNNDRGDHWWRIDLLGVYNISCVSIYNKIEHNITMTGAQIHVGNSRENNGTNNNICANITHFNRGQWNDFTCAEQVSGRYVTVFLPQQIGLILCEVEIYGKKRESPFKLIKENKTWEHALEYCRERKMDLATILDKDDQTLAELEARRADTLFLWLGLHYTCILDVWFWVADYRLEFNRWAPGEKTGDCDRSAVMERAEDHKWFSKSDYDEFNFICQKF